MIPIAKGRAVALGDVVLLEPDGVRKHYRRAVVLVFDELHEFRKAVDYGAIQAVDLCGQPEGAKTPQIPELDQ